MVRSITVPHLARFRFARETEELRRKVERRQAAYLWGQRHFVKPRLVSRAFGDGKKLIWLEGINTRPAWWVVRVDSLWNTSNFDPPPNLCDHLEEIFEAIEEEYGTGEKENGDLYADARFPQGCGLGSGECWGEITGREFQELTKGV